jgi:hypothetical protein
MYDSRVLALERFDPFLEVPELIKHPTALADSLSDPPPTLTVSAIQPTMAYLLDTEELMETGDHSLQFQLSRAFIPALAFSVRNDHSNPRKEGFFSTF